MIKLMMIVSAYLILFVLAVLTVYFVGFIGNTEASIDIPGKRYSLLTFGDESDRNQPMTSKILRNLLVIIFR